jgi:4-carboxymuconolactone decarboxylase
MMSRDDEKWTGLTMKEKELTAIGAAIASNCVPCIEYHIPQARKAGLSDSQIREAIELADKVRRVPAVKVLQTANSLLEVKNTLEPGPGDVPCGCSDTKMALEENAGSREQVPHADRVQLDQPGSKEDNGAESESAFSRAGDSTNECSSGKSEEGSQNSADNSGFDRPRMMEMMGECCPEKMKELSSMMADFMDGRGSSEEERSSEASRKTKPAS